MVHGLALLLAAAAPVAAHPFDASFYGHDLAVEVRGRTLEVRYAAEVPTRSVLAAFDPDGVGAEALSETYTAEFTRLRLQELVEGLHLAVNGVDLALVPLPSPAPTGLGNRKYFRYDLLLQAELPAGAGPFVVALSNRNHPTELGVFRTEVLVDPGVVVADCSLLVRGPDGAVRRDRSAGWRMEEENRELALVFERRDGLAGRGLRWLAGVQGGPRTLQQALRRSPVEVLARRDASAWAAGVALVVASAVGVAARPGRFPVWFAGAAAAAGVGAAVVGGVPEAWWVVAELAGGGLLAAGTLLAVAGRPWGLALGLAGLAAAFHAWPGSLVVPALSLVGLAAWPTAARRAALALVVAASAAVVLRAVAALTG